MVFTVTISTGTNNTHNHKALDNDESRFTASSYYAHLGTVKNTTHAFVWVR